MADYRNSFNRGLMAVLFMVLAAMAGCADNETDIQVPKLTVNGIDPVTTTRTHQLTGTVDPGAMVTVTVAPTAIVNPVVVDQGTWTCTVVLGDGLSTIGIKAVDSTGNQSILTLALTYDALSIETFVTPIADGAAGLTIGGLVDPTVTAPLNLTVTPADTTVPPFSVVVDPVGDTWSASLTGLAIGSNTIKVSRDIQGLGLVEKSVIIGVNAAAPQLTIAQPRGEILIPSQVVTGSLDPAISKVTVTPLPASGTTVASGTWSATLSRLGSGKNTIVATGTANNVTVTARSLVRYNSVAPLLREVSPANGSTGVAASSTVTAEFGTAMAAGTITPATFTLSDGVNLVAATVSYDEPTLTATLTPATPLAPGGSYTASLATAITDQNGLPLAQALNWNFTVSQ